MKIESFELREIIDSRTKPTVEAEVNGFSGKAPSGASTGKHEAECFVPENLEEIENELKEQLEGKKFTQKEFDEKLRDYDGTNKLSNIGAVGIASSFAFKNASGFKFGKNFPLPLSNVIGGGEHGGNTSIQEFLVLPVEAESFPEAVKTNAKIYQELKEKYPQKIRGINDEGALITSMDDEQTLKALKKVADEHGARIGLDVAASEFYENDEYKLSSMSRTFTADEHLKFIQHLIEKFNLIYVEDPFDQDDFVKHEELLKENRGNDVLICGDDLFTTDKERLQHGIDLESANSLIVKPNQIGTVTDAKETVELAHENGYVPVISHRSGETCDSTISRLALEWDCPVIKAGIADIRVAKLNELIRTWDEVEDPKLADL
ncbi:enolase C-terminal domain-like protein [Candidatus Nanohalococcus occultus]|uniref:phosphopyruvate hydratase n=1 Tax=Candidatus Nanohalococcus occultus TaxID=2978047 RepID=A0ABY8CDQ4_9ARCH|nr:Enolase [Candidatus Nanohaloarchaeota archaeon SVXNc]